ncbi:MAG: protein kinase [bacterium]|nr:protein kinase [bacterium]
MEPRTPPPELLESLLARALELRDRGRADWLEEAVRDCPEFAEPVRRAAQQTETLAQVLVRPPASDPAVGRTLASRFRLIERAGAGAMGVVYRAEDQELTRLVAVKVIRNGLTKPEEALRRFAREAEAMASVQHPSVLTLHDSGQTDEGEPFIVMEWVDGAALSDVVERARELQDGALQDGRRVEDARWLHADLGLELRGESSYVCTVVRWVVELAEGLHDVHEAGVLHRDVKPSNVLVRRDGRPALLDFGLALLDVDSTLTRGSASVGTPAFMPPEALARHRKYTRASDVYSLTATLYHLLTLRPPYRGTPTEVLAAIATRDPVPAARVRTGLPRDLLAILDKGMARHPSARYATAGALAADLRALLEHRPVVACPVPPLARVARRVARSKVARGAALVLALVALSSAALQVRAASLARRHARGFAALRQLPPSFTIVGRANRAYRYEEDRAQVARLLDEAVEDSADALRALLLRASFRLDHGGAVGAAEDMRALAGRAGGEYARWLAERYEALPADARSADDVGWEGEPAPRTPVDRYLRGYHLLRVGREAEGYALFADPELRAIDHAEELRLTTIPFGELAANAQEERAVEAYGDAIRLEERLGGRTATTAHLAGRMLDLIGQYDQALEVLVDGIELADRAYTIRINAGFAAFGQGHFEEARRHLDVAIDLRPNYRKPLQVLLWVLLAEGRFDQALERIERAPLEAAPDAPKWRLVQRASVETHRALALRASGEPQAAQASVERAVEHILAAQELGPIVYGADFTILEGLADGDEDAVFRGLAQLLLQDPHHQWVLLQLTQHMPEDLGPEATAAVQRVLQAQIPTLASRRSTPAAAKRED